MKLNIPLKLTCPVMHYPWGKYGNSSLIADLTNSPTAERDEPFAEFWIGAHKKAPAETVVDGKNWFLDKLIGKYPEELLGSFVQQKFGAELPFLFKVLSVRTALSIQAHPDKAQAVELHARDPENYPDANHKPEVAIALSPLTMLIGFRPLKLVFIYVA